jgi:hypothetical protein
MKNLATQTRALVSVQEGQGTLCPSEWYTAHSRSLSAMKRVHGPISPRLAAGHHKEI